jgi:phenylacetate-CoA ligase
MNFYGRLYRRVLLPVFDGLVKRRKTIQYWQLAENSQWQGRESLENQQLRDLKAILHYAKIHCEYYRQQWADLGLNPDSVQSLQDFCRWPLLTRDAIRTHRMRMQTKDRMKRITKSTGGSTGQPLVFDLDHESNERRTAIMYRGYNWAGSGPGTRRLLIWGADLKRSSFWKSVKVALHHCFEQQLLMNCFDFSDGNMRNQFALMERYRPETIIAYTSPLYEFSKFMKAHALQPHGIRSIVVGAEKIYGFQRKLIEEVFQAPVFETYGSREFMLIGAECELHCGLHLSIENLLVEVLDDQGLPTPDGEEGNVVITDLFNRGMPFVRYVNGDRALAGFTQCRCGRGLPLLRTVVGRQLDVISTSSGRVIPGELFPHLLKDYPSVRRFQVHQHQLDAIEIKVVGDEKLDEVYCKQIHDRLVECLGNEIRVLLDPVADIPLTSAGKHQVVINHVARAKSL